MSLLREYPLSVIKEATERSDSDQHSSHYEHDGLVPDYPQRAASEGRDPALNYLLPRGSIFSSETSYGELLPAGQSAFVSRGLGVSLPSMYDKSLPSLPRGSVAKTLSAPSAVQTESARGSVAKSESSKRSAAKSQVSIHSVTEPDSPRRASTAKRSHNSLPRPDLANTSNVSESIAEVPPSPPSKSSRSRSSTASSVTSSSSSPSTLTHSASSQTTLRTLDGVMDEVTTSLALRTKLRAEMVATTDHTQVGVCSTMSHVDSERFIRTLASKIHEAMALQSSYLFALIPDPVRGPLEGSATLAFCGAPQRLVTKASILAGLRFKTRLAELQDTTGTWIGHLEAPAEGFEDLDPLAHDEDILWDIVRKAANPIDPVEAPPGSRGIEQLLNEARARLDRLTPQEAFRESYDDGILVDIRPEFQRAEYGIIPRAIVIERNVLEWRFDPRCLDGRLPIADRYDLRVIIFCQEGFTSSLAAAALQDIGLWRTTDIDGGFAKWKHEGLPILDIPEDMRTLGEL